MMPSNAKAWQKLIQSCKYFFAKNQIFVIENLSFTRDYRIKLSSNGFEKPFDIAKVPCKLWINEIFHFPYFISLIIPKIYRCDVKFLRFFHQTISFDAFLFLSSYVEIIELEFVTVENENGSIVPFEKLVEILPKIKEIKFYDLTSSIITTNTVKELLKIPHFSKINEIEIKGLTETFDIQSFFGYLKENKHTCFQLLFDSSISQPFKICLEKIIDEIIETEEHDYKPPYIYFFGLAYDKMNKMQKIFCQSSPQHFKRLTAKIFCR
uniref:Uncharacterized protein n=1 Tax=Panagrolaimus davidi TaxID=227884 RepID=A0A914PR26_9BILA